MFHNSPKTLALVAFTYFVLAAAAIWLTRLNGGVALLWAANGALIASLCASRRRRWPGLLAAAAVGSASASALTSPLHAVAPLLVAANMGEAVLAAELLRRWHASRAPFQTMRSLGRFVVAAAVLAPALSGTIGAGSVALALNISFGAAWVDWGIGHGLGNLIITPVAFLLVRGEIRWRRAWPGRDVAELLALALLVVGVTVGVFAQTGLPLLFLPILPVLVATFRAGRPGAAGGIVLVAAIGGMLTMTGHGPILLIRGSDALQLQFFQFYLGTIVLIALPVAATLAERDTLTAALAESQARYQLLADHAVDIMLSMDADGTIRFASPSVRELGYFDPAALVGRNAATLVVPEDRGRVMAVHAAALAAPGETQTVEYRATRADGSVAWFETTTRAVLGSDGRIAAVISVIRDSSQRKSREDELARAADTDPLTGLLNRAAFRRRVADALAPGGSAGALALLDLDHFKRVNDTHGHAAGDAALLITADLLRASVRPTDAVGRVGGEEFAVLLQGAGLSEAQAVCERIRANLAAQPVTVPDGAVLAITASLGLACLTGGEAIDAPFGRADDALYAAKDAGRNRVVLAEPSPSR